MTGVRAKPWPLLALAALASLAMLATTARSEPSATRGKAVYDSYCVICHGDQGDGKGLMGIIHRAQQNGFVVTVYPRDFTAGVYKFRTTASGDLPTDEDLIRTVTNGIVRSGMPSHKDLTRAQIEDVVEYIKSFSPRWTEELPGDVVEIGPPPKHVGTKASVQKGNEIYALMKCGECHGETGLGDGPSSANLKDDWGDRIVPFDFTSGPLKGGTRTEDLARTFLTGLDGTPMPSYDQTITLDQQWDLVSYCLYLMQGGDEGKSK